MNRSADANAELELLSALGFGAESALMREPKLFVDGRFLGALLAELEDELGAPDSARVLFQIGLLHGLRDAYRLSGDDAPDSHGPGSTPVAEPTLLAIGLHHAGDHHRPGSIELVGTWPEAYEAEARLSRLGSEERPCCSLSAGYTSGWLSGTLEADVFAVEQSCMARGDESCTFRAAELSLLRERAEGRDELALLPALSYSRLREIARSRLTEAASRDALHRPDPDADAVHIWGPVMVLPFTDVEDALLTVEALGGQSATADVRAVVVDLRGIELEDEIAAAGLEYVLDAIEAWGAEALLTGISPLCESLVADIESSHLLIRKDLPDAVAAAFQVAEAQRHLL